MIQIVKARENFRANATDVKEGELFKVKHSRKGEASIIEVGDQFLCMVGSLSFNSLFEIVLEDDLIDEDDFYD